MPANEVMLATGIRIVEAPRGEKTVGRTAITTEQYATHILAGILASPPGHPLQSSGIDPTTMADIVDAFAPMPDAAAYCTPAPATRLSDRTSTTSRRRR